MLTRLKVDGFKNLIDVDVRFGPFSCVAGANGVGKSNLFDAVRFLSTLADRSLVDACLSVRDDAGRAGDLQSIFHRSGDFVADRMSFEAEMIVPRHGEDDLGQRAEASITFLRYKLVLAFRQDLTESDFGGIEIVREELSHIRLGDAYGHLGFKHSPDWRASAVQGRRSTPYLISTEGGEESIIKLHQDGNGGRPVSRAANRLPRTILSAANAAESPTTLLARREMQSWRLLQLEPSSLRKPDPFSAPSHIGSDGSHLPATLYRLAKQEDEPTDETNSVYVRVANRLSDLIHDVRSLLVDRDERRELYSLLVSGKDDTRHNARSLSDGTLRFLALATIVNDPDEAGVLCLEEPENGIHPERIPAIIHLLQDISCDTSFPIGPDNPLRQVIINTHSPAVVAEIPDDALIVAEPHKLVRGGRTYSTVRFSALADTWRTTKDPNHPVVAKGKLIAYLNPFVFDIEGRGHRSRIIDREDLQPLLPFRVDA